MKKLIGWFLILGLCLFGQDSEKSVTMKNTSGSVSKMTLTLDDAKKLALAQNPTIAQALAAIDATAAAVRQAEAAYWPKLTLDATGARYEDQPTRPDKGYDTHSEFAISGNATYTVFDGFKRKMALMVAGLDRESAIESHDDTKRLLLRSVSLAFYSALLAQDSMAISKRDAEYNYDLLEDAEKRHNGGLVKPSEVLNFKLKVGKAEVDYYEAQNQWRVSCIALGQLLGIVQNEIWETIDLVKPEESTILNETYNLDELLAYAEMNRPDLKQAQTMIDGYKAGIEAAKSSLYPTLELFAKYGLERENNIHFNDDFDRVCYYGVSSSWTLFNGGLTRAQIAQAEAQLRSAVYNRENILLEVRSEIRENLISLQSAIEVWRKNQDLVKIAEEIRELVYEEYLGSRATITRVNEVQNDLIVTTLACSQSYIKVLSLMETLSASVGKNLE